MSYYSKCIGDLLEFDKKAAARVLSNRAACLVEVGLYEPSLEDARKAAELDSDWWRPWSRVGLAAAVLGDRCEPDSELWFGYCYEAHSAYFRTVELEPTPQHVAKLYDAAARVESKSAEAAKDSKDRGNKSIKADLIGEAIAEYTVGIARLPLKPTAEG